MTSDRIRIESHPDGFWLREIAAQLAEIVETLRSDRSLSVVLYPSTDSIPVKISEV